MTYADFESLLVSKDNGKLWWLKKIMKILKNLLNVGSTAMIMLIIRLK